MEKVKTETFTFSLYIKSAIWDLVYFATFYEK